MKKSFKLISLLLAMIMCLSMAACGEPEEKVAETPVVEQPNSEVTAEPVAKDTLIYGSGDYTRINPALDEHGEINVLIFDGLTDHDGDGKVIPRLAESWDFDKETNTYTFHLRNDVKWHDGEPFTAEDVAFTYGIIMDPDNGSENAPNYEDVKEISVLDDYTVSFRLEAPNSAFLDYMTMSILPKHLLEGEDVQESAYFRKPVGTGPYMLDEWDAGQAIVLKRNEDYFAGKANIPTIIFKIVPDYTVRALQLQTGELDLAQVTPKDSVSFENDEKHTVYDMTTADYRGILYNFANPFWQKNADIIPAISYAIDKQAILDAVVLGKGIVGYSPIQRNVYNYEDVEHYDYNPEKAVEILESVGCEKDSEGFWCRDGERLSFTINAHATDQVRIDMAQIAVQQLREIGLDVNAAVPPEGIDWGGQECCIIGWGSPFDADDHTYKVFGTDKGANYSSYSNELVDKYLTEARRTDDPEKRAEAYANFQKVLAENPAYTFFCYIDALYVADKDLKGIDPNTVLGHHGVGIFWNVCDWTF